MLVSFRQTYGGGREELFEIFERDKRLIDLYNLCDLNIFSFHNCSGETISGFKKHNPVKNSEYLIMNDISYTETVRTLKILLQQKGCTHFLFTQDDTFSMFENEDVDFNELVEYAKGYSDNFMLSLYNKNAILNPRDPDIKLKTFDVYETTTLDFFESDRTPWPFDDTPYICTIDMLNEIYDEEYFESPDIWEAERLLRDRYKKKEINRFVTNKQLFRNYNLFGKTLFMTNIFRRILKENGLL